MPLPRPAFTLDFARGGIIPPRLAYSRTSKGGYVNSIGIYSSASANVPRLTFDPSNFMCRGFLTEPAATNVLLRSEDFANASWTKQNATVTASSTTAPDGSGNGTRINEDSTASAVHNITQTTTAIAPSVKQCLSVWAKRDSRNLVLLIGDNAAQGNAVLAAFDLSTGQVGVTFAVGNGSVSAVGIKAYPNGWYRCYISGTPNNSGTTTLARIMLASGTTVASYTYTGDGTSGTWVWGAQLETGAYPSSYIVTTSGAVARIADSALLTPVDFLSLTQGTLFWEGEIEALAVDSRIVVISDLSTNNNIMFTLGPSTGTSLHAVINAGGTERANMTVNAALSVDTRYAAAFAWSSGEAACACNGVFSASSAPAALPSGLDRIGIGMTAGAGGTGCAAVHGKVSYWPYRLPDAYLTMMTG